MHNKDYEMLAMFSALSDADKKLAIAACSKLIADRKAKKAQGGTGANAEIHRKVGNKADLAEIGKLKMVVGGGDQKSEAARIGSINIDKPDSPKHNTQAEIAKTDLAEIGAAKRKDTEGRPSNTVVNIDNSYLPKHNTQAEIAKADLAEIGAAKRSEVKMGNENAAKNKVVNIDNDVSPKHDTRAEIAKAAGQLTN